MLENSILSHNEIDDLLVGFYTGKHGAGNKLRAYIFQTQDIVVTEKYRQLSIERIVLSTCAMGGNVHNLIANKISESISKYFRGMSEYRFQKENAYNTWLVKMDMLFNETNFEDCEVSINRMTLERNLSAQLSLFDDFATLLKYYWVIECGRDNIDFINKIYEDNFRGVNFVSQRESITNNLSLVNIKENIQKAGNKYGINIDLNGCEVICSDSRETKYTFNIRAKKDIIIISRYSSFSEICHEFGHYIFFP